MLITKCGCVSLSRSSCRYGQRVRRRLRRGLRENSRTSARAGSARKVTPHFEIPRRDYTAARRSIGTRRRARGVCGRAVRRLGRGTGAFPEACAARVPGSESTASGAWPSSTATRRRMRPRRIRARAASLPRAPYRRTPSCADGVRALADFTGSRDSRPQVYRLRLRRHAKRTRAGRLALHPAFETPIGGMANLADLLYSLLPEET